MTTSNAQIRAQPVLDIPKYKVGDCARCIRPLLLLRPLLRPRLEKTYGIITAVFHACEAFEEPRKEHNEELTNDDHIYFWYSQVDAVEYWCFQSEIEMVK